jgi:GT2 family glycosyltransferase
MLGECVRVLVAALERVPEKTELLVVANDLSGRGQENVRRIAPDAHLLDPGRNLGFSPGVTLALAQAAGEWIALINDDCVVDPDAIAELLAAGCEADDIGSVAAQVRFARQPALINSAGLEIDELGVAYERLVGIPVSEHAPDTREVFGASGGAALYRRGMLDEVGGFDGSFFAYLEDADLAWRARMHGWRCLYAPRAIAYHHHSSTLGHASRSKDFLVGRNRVRMLAKNATGAQLRRRGLHIVAYDCAQVAFALVRRGTLAPLRGRLVGLSEWRTYRAAGRRWRKAVPLASTGGLRAALRRDHAYRQLNS